MRRREFVQLTVGTAMTWPLRARAQQKAMPVIGYIASASPERDTIFLPNIRQGLNATGYVEGQNLAIETRSAEGDLDRMPALVAELVDRDVDLILMIDGLPGAVAAKNATSRIPIVSGPAPAPASSG
jgi:putative ABC transport system substrate-binding protein